MHNNDQLTDHEVMQHTASIWKYHPIKDNGIANHDESYATHCDYGVGEITAARVRGKKHKHDGTNCDDWFETAETNGCLVAVVSDGAGSKPLSRFGARLCCESAVQYITNGISELLSAQPDLKDRLSGDMAGAEFSAACGSIARLVQSSAGAAFDSQLQCLKDISNDEKYISALGRKPELSDLSATFLAAVVIPLTINGEKQTFCAAVQIGDGFICAINSNADCDSCLKLLGSADSGEYSGETRFLSLQAADSGYLAGRTRICRGSSDTIMLMTDGVADDYFPAEPMMKRLFIDLQLNGILLMRGIVPRPQSPSPIEFPVVTPDGGSMAVQYAKQLLSDSIDINALWNMRAQLKCHSLAAHRRSLGNTPQQRLLTWLDSYNERGSFDDRTLVLITT